MTTPRQPLMNILVRLDTHEYTTVCFKVVRHADGVVEIHEAEHVVNTLPKGAEVLMISDRGTCWHRFHCDRSVNIDAAQVPDTRIPDDSFGNGY